MVKRPQKNLKMKIFKPDWINHTRKLKVPIFSIHINPINNKIATGGQDYRIKIWNFHSLQKDEECDLLLSTLVLHDGLNL